MKAEWSNKDSLEMPTTTNSDYIKREDAITKLEEWVEQITKELRMNDYDDYTNLWNETVEILRINGLTPKDIRFVCGNDFGVSNFEELAKHTNYSDSYGGQEIAEDLKIVGDYWWLERHEYDGSEWWEYKELPKRPEKFIAVKNLKASVGWKTLAELERGEYVTE